MSKKQYTVERVGQMDFFDNYRVPYNDVASADLAKITLDADEKALMKLWEDILAEAKRTTNYDSRLTYGVYQITKELNTSHKTGTGRS